MLQATAKVGLKNRAQKAEIFPPCDGEVCLDPPCLVQHQIIHSIQDDDGDECDDDDDDDDDIEDAADDDEIEDLASGESTWFNIRVYTVLPTAWPTRLLAVIFIQMVLIITSDYNHLNSVL